MFEGMLCANGSPFLMNDPVWPAGSDTVSVRLPLLSLDSFATASHSFSASGGHAPLHAGSEAPPAPSSSSTHRPSRQPYRLEAGGGCGGCGG